MQDESQRLLLEYYRNPTIIIRNRIVILNTGLVRKIASKMSKICPERYEDLEQIGYIGLMKAINSFLPSSGNKFSTYAFPYIDGSIRHYLRDKYRIVKLPRRLEQMYKDGEKARKKLKEELGRNASELEIANHLNITISEWQEAMKIKDARSTLSLDVSVSKIEGITLGDSLSDEASKIKTKSDEEYQFIRDIVSTLDLKFQQVVEYVYFKGLHRKQAAEIIGVSPMTVSRRLDVAICQIRELYKDQVGTPS
jgi:RNA polymerase sigma-B factor